MKIPVIVACLFAASHAKFCPGEENGNKCAAKDNSYKCAVFFENLTPKRPLTWIGALPDALKKAKNQDEVEEILGENVTEESFQQLDDCSTVTANARCYAILQRTKSIRLDSCDRNLINTRGSETVGDFLCGQVRRWKRRDADFKTNGIRNLKLPFFYSACNGDWERITEGGNDLYFDEDLCCDSNGKYFQCDGEDYNKDC